MAYAQKVDNSTHVRCVQMYQEHSVPEALAEGLVRHARAHAEIDNAPLTIQPVMLGLRGPNLTLTGRDVRMAMRHHQSSPQELWRNAQWNAKAPPCPPQPQNFKKSILRSLYKAEGMDVQAGYASVQPHMLTRARFLMERRIERRSGFIFAGALAVPVLGNSSLLLRQDSQNKAVRRDMARFSNRVEIDRAFISWRTSPLSDVHMALSAGFLEEMYGGAGMEVVWRPFGRPYWFEGDGWVLRKRDSARIFNAAFTGGAFFSGHVRAGYDFNNSRWSMALAAGRYLGGDTGATASLWRSFEDGTRIEAALGWSDMDEVAGFFKNTHFSPSLRVRMPLQTGNNERFARLSLAQVGRDATQMLARPLPLEEVTQAFATREILRGWQDLLK